METGAENFLLTLFFAKTSWMVAGVDLRLDQPWTALESLKEKGLERNLFDQFSAKLEFV